MCYQCYHLCLNRDWTSSHYLSNLIRKALWSGGKQAFIACIVHGRKNLGHLWWCNLIDNQKACSNIMLWLIVRKAGEQRQASSSKKNHSRPERTETYTRRVTLYNDGGECLYGNISPNYLFYHQWKISIWRLSYKIVWSGMKITVKCIIVMCYLFTQFMLCSLTCSLHGGSGIDTL